MFLHSALWSQPNNTVGRLSSLCVRCISLWWCYYFAATLVRTHANTHTHTHSLSLSLSLSLFESFSFFTLSYSHSLFLIHTLFLSLSLFSISSYYIFISLFILSLIHTLFLSLCPFIFFSLLLTHIWSEWESHYCWISLYKGTRQRRTLNNKGWQS